MAFLFLLSYLLTWGFSIDLFNLLLVLPLFTACGKGGEHVHTFSDEWSSDESKHWHAATCGHDVKDSEGTHIDENLDNFCDICAYELQKSPTTKWNETQKKIFKEHLYGFELPCIDGLDVEWDEKNQCVIVYGASVDSDSFNSYVDSIVSQGFSKEAGPYDDSYALYRQRKAQRNCC